MKLLLIADIEQPQFWQPEPEMFDDIDLILSAGDLKPEYLNRLAKAGLASARRTYLLCVYGNHDDRCETELSKDCVCLDGDLLTVKGLRILGLGGSPRYRPGPHQYSEEEMCRRIDGLERTIRRSRGVDLVLTHAPPRGFGDTDDPVHSGFRCFVPLLDQLRPRYLIHGHVHLDQDGEGGRISRCGETTVINACGSWLLDL